ncbi:hypothetical protein NI389_15740 [Pseudoalteromonas xiamenensis]|uniref:hypothetical protein n=1 Tax=Pseudoalteromonas xiamenensis TaxID=882626 RepID=UPI0027E3FBF1|nr:hypothetical protein [Pseudoalteromonas xiamenensis]WMN59610.1 hypothetical protein NI389_15740 [Pseudoalteromonas xiamenensis]
MEEFLVKNASAVFALSGAIVGSLITGLINYATKTKESKLRVTEKLLDKKLEAHESLLSMVSWIRTMVLLGGEDSQGELKRCPIIMESQKSKDEFLEAFVSLQNRCDRWFSASVKREVSFFLDYFVNLNEHSREASDNSLQEAGVIIRNDFIDIASELENCAHQFFNKDLLKLNYKTDRNWHKFTSKETIARLNKTEFYKRKKQVLQVLSGRI